MKLRQFFGGTQQVTVETTFPPRLLNLCAKEQILFWGLQWNSNSNISFSIPQKHLSLLHDLVEKQGGILSVGESQGLPRICQRFSRRFGFLVGLSLSLFAVSVLSQFIFVVDISGNEQVSTGEIRIALEKAGLDVGVYGKTLALSQLTQVAMSHLEGISWMSVNLYGTRAEVIVRESTKAPEIPPVEGLYDVISEADGIISAIQVHNGEALVELGETIGKGQVLISGNVELKPAEYSTEPSQWMSLPASGQIWARTWRSLTAVIPLTAQVKESLGVAMNGYSLDFFGQSKELFNHCVLFPTGYEKSRSSYFLPKLDSLPFSLTHVEETPYQLRTQDLNLNGSRSLLEEALKEELDYLVGEQGQILTTEFTAIQKDGVLSVTLLAECYEEIGTQVVGSVRQPVEELEDLEELEALEN